MDELMTYPYVLLDKSVMFPGMLLNLELEDAGALAAIKSTMMGQRTVFVALKPVSDGSDGKLPMSKPVVYGTGAEITDEEGFSTKLDLNFTTIVGTVCAIRQMVKLPNGKSRVVLYGKERCKVVAKKQGMDYDLVKVESFPLRILLEEDIQKEAMYRVVMESIRKFAEHNSHLPKDLIKKLSEMKDVHTLVEEACYVLPMPQPLRQVLLECENDVDRSKGLCQILLREASVIEIQNGIRKQVQANIDKNQKEFVLREQLKVIREELGDAGPLEEGENFKKRVDELIASEEVKEAIRAEIKRYVGMGTNNGEGGVIRNYIETMLSLPWDKVSVDNPDMSHAKEVLDRDHYGLTKIKERILEFLAVRQMTDNLNSPILLLVGPPGTGKTSIAKSIAEALNREYVRVCLGGVRDESEIRGHRRTYIASMPGRIVQGLKQAGVKNPLMLLDEVDKIGSDYKGDPSAALLEVLDSAQNNRFVDHFIEQPVDLSHVIFLATANTTDTIPRPLLDRMEVIELSSYTKNEKMHIAKEHLLPKQLKQHGLTASKLSITDKALNLLIEDYTREAGVRSLERKLGDICRKACAKICETKESEKPVTKQRVGEKNLAEYAGRKKFRREEVAKKPEIGVVHGLAWTAVGGVLLDVEVGVLPGKGDFILTGSLGDVMKESAGIGRSYLRSIADEIGVEDEVFQKKDLHIHAPEGATPKDGPSAGITMVTAMYSALTGTPIRQDVAMTGEVTLRGRVLPIGGLKEKLLAANTNGMKDVIIPMANKPDLLEISPEIIGDMKIHPVSHVKEVLEIAKA